MRGLSIRARLLFAVGVVALVNVLAAVVVISVTSDQFLDQIDERLLAAADETSALDGQAGQTVTVGDVYSGLLTPDGQLTTWHAVRNRGRLFPPPAVEDVRAGVTAPQPLTVEAERGQLEYRMVSVDSADGAVVLASPLDGYEFALNRLTAWVVGAAAAVILVLGVVAWWVLRLGIRPMKQMTAAAEVIAAGDLSERISGIDPGTEAGQLGLALNTMMGRIEDSFEERSRAEARLRQFIADASHELRTPVATIRGYTELYQAGGLDDRTELDDAMRRTGQESERMSRLVIDLLNLAKLDRDPTIRSGPVELVSLVREVVTDAEASHPNRAFEVDLPDEPLVIEADPDLLRQAVSNLVVNTVVHTDAPATCRVRVRSEGDQAAIGVIDDGEGMSEEVAGRATERFFRADPSRGRDTGGSGLGLAIVASIVDAHGGELMIDSAPGLGTTVTIRVPVAVSVDDSQQTPRSLPVSSEVDRGY